MIYLYPYEKNANKIRKAKRKRERRQKAVGGEQLHIHTIINFIILLFNHLTMYYADWQVTAQLRRSFSLFLSEMPKRQSNHFISLLVFLFFLSAPRPRPSANHFNSIQFYSIHFISFHLWFVPNFKPGRGRAGYSTTPPNQLSLSLSPLKFTRINQFRDSSFFSLFLLSLSLPKREDWIKLK